MSYEFYKFLHLSCLALVLLSSGLLLSKAYIKDLPPKKMLTIVHGVSLLLFLIAGFGLLARTGQNGAFSSGWLWIKLITWGFLGALPAFVKRASSAFLQKLFFLYAAAVLLSIYAVTFKPF